MPTLHYTYDNFLDVRRRQPPLKVQRNACTLFEFLSEFAVALTVEAVTVLLQGPTTEINSKTALQPWCSLYGPGVSLYKHITCYVKIYLTFCSTQPSILSDKL